MGMGNEDGPLGSPSTINHQPSSPLPICVYLRASAVSTFRHLCGTGAKVMDREAVLATVDGARDEIVDLTRALVRLETVNTGEMPTGNETMAAEFLRSKLA